MTKYLLAVMLLGISGCGYTIKSEKKLRQEYFYQFHLGMQVAYEDFGHFAHADRERDKLKQIDDGTYWGLR